MAGTGLTFDEFRQAVSQVEVAAAPAQSMPPRPFTIEQARKEFGRFEAKSPGQAAERLHNSSSRLYWLLRLRDSGLMRACGYSYYKPVPTIEDDRKKVEELLRQGGRNLNKSGAGNRASIRDQTWLQARIQAQPAGTAAPQSPAQRVQQERAVALSRAVFSVLRTQARPARVHAGMLAKFVQISMHQAQHTIAHTPALQALIAAVNAGKDRRLAFWAARGFIEEGRYPSANEVLVRAGLNTTRVNRQFCIEAISCFTAGHRSR